MNQVQRDIVRKKRVLDYAEACGNVNKACRHFGVTRFNFYLWRNIVGCRFIERNREQCSLEP
ncbi:MAG: hypothetical protein ABIN69_18745 [Aestuariivirga sp.]